MLNLATAGFTAQSDPGITTDKAVAIARQSAGAKRVVNNLHVA